uniref:Exonuclease mut-7-like protein n=1 Tax=Noccaea caerulescens TaxID=107243 RepID=A0A1J3J838_NOCCA
MESNLKINLVSSTDSAEFTRLKWSLTRSTVIALDAEWKPQRSNPSSFPTVTLLQVACRLGVGDAADDDVSDVFLIDLTSIHLASVWELLNDMFVSPDVLKLGFRFKQDLVYLSSTFTQHGCEAGFHEVKQYLDITSVYNHLQYKRFGRKAPKDIKSLSAICKEMLDISLSKELQCSDWSHRPLTEEQKLYAATDAHCLLQLFDVFKANLVEGITVLDPIEINVGLKGILTGPDCSSKAVTIRLCKATEVIRAMTENGQNIANGVVSRKTTLNTMPMDENLLKIVRKYGERILLKESDLLPKNSKKKTRRRATLRTVNTDKYLVGSVDWQGPPPWDSSLGGDGCPKFLLDVMVEGLAKHLRCVGIDAAVPQSKKPDSRELLDQAHKENRVLLTRDTKLLRHQDLAKNQIYRVKSLLKNEQLLEVIETFKLKISGNQLMSRCTKCNGRFIQKPLSIEEAIEAAKGFQRIPNCLFNKNLEFWQCMNCHQLYWEGTQYHNAVQKFMEVCKLSE